MPVVGSSAYNTAGQITALIRSLLNDSAGNLFTDGLLIPYVNSAYRKVQRALAAAGQETFLVDDVLLVVPAVTAVDPSLQVAIDDSTRAAKSIAHGFISAARSVGAAKFKLR